MGWGFLSGLGRGLENASLQPQQYYENKRKALVEDSQLESQALTRALAMAAGMQGAEKHPLEMENLRGALALNTESILGKKADRARSIIGTVQGRGFGLSEADQGFLTEQGYGAAFGPNGMVDVPTLERQVAESEMERNRNSGQAALIGAGASRTSANSGALVDAARVKLLDAQTAAGGFNPGGGRSMSGRVGQVLSHARALAKQEMDSIMGNRLTAMQFSKQTPEQQQATLRGIQNRAFMNAQQQAAFTVGDPLTPQEMEQMRRYMEMEIQTGPNPAAALAVGDQAIP